MATVGFITEANAIAYVHKIALDKGAAFDAEDEALITRACDRAWKRIRAILLERDVALVDITKWEDGANAQYSLTAYYGLKDLLVAKSREIPPWLESFNVEAEIRRDTLVATDGSILAKGAGGSGRIFGLDLEKQMHDDEELSEGDYDD